MPFQRRERPMEEATRMALELDCPRVVIHGPYARSWDTPHARRWLQSLDACRRAIEGSSVRLALENPGLYSARDRDNVFAAPDDFARFCRDRDLSVTLDTCHAGTAGIDLMVACETLDGLLANVHLSDLATPHLLWDHHITRTLFAHHQMPGEGILPLAQMMGRLNLAGYQGPITMEISPFALRAWWGPLLRRRLGRLVAFYRDSLA
jgi:sugar phosphate isomerase/epimerase